MGGRLSAPRGPEKLAESSRPHGSGIRYTGINARTLTAPFAAVIMASLLFVYARTSIRAAKLNARQHREADGGALNWANESARRHGQIEGISDKGQLRQALVDDDIEREWRKNRGKDTPQRGESNELREAGRIARMLAKEEKASLDEENTK